MARKWVKVWVSESLRGTMRFDFTPAERSVWYDLLLLAGESRLEGLIAPGKDSSYPLRWLANTLNISPSLLHRTIEKCKMYSRIEVNGDGIRILNWNRYQSEYERQKPFRAKKVTQKVTKKLPVEEEEEEVEVEEKKYIKKFEQFWSAYPRKEAKVKAEQAFKKINPDEKLLATMLDMLERFKKTKQWQDRQLIPHPATWLNAKRWEDELDKPEKIRNSWS